MEALSFTFICILGAVVGSFLNVFIYRFNTNMSFGGRSMCLYCGKTLSWYELVPVFSFLYLQGRCATCKSRISWQYPLVELLTAVVFAGAALFAAERFAGLEFIGYLALLFFASALLIVIAVYDIRHTIVPDRLVLALAVAGLARVFLFPVPGESTLIALLAGPLLALPFALIFFISGGRLMGFGDAKLVLGIGWMLGLWQGIAMLLFSFWIGGLAALILLFFRSQRFTMKSEIPFAPFLVLGAFLTLFIPAERLFSLIF